MRARFKLALFYRRREEDILSDLGKKIFGLLTLGYVRRFFSPFDLKESETKIIIMRYIYTPLAQEENRFFRTALSGHA